MKQLTDDDDDFAITALTVAKGGEPVTVSGGMSKELIAKHILFIEANVPLEKIDDYASLTESEYQRIMLANKTINNLPIFIQ